MAGATRIPGEQAALLAAVVADADDDLPRLVYADWLEEHGETRQAEYIRVCLRMMGMQPGDSGYEEVCDRWRELGGRPDGVMERDWLAKMGLTRIGEVIFSRGLPETVKCYKPSNFFAEAPALFRVAPIRRIKFTTEPGGRPLTDRGLGRLASMPELGRVVGLEFWGPRSRAPLRGWREFFASPHLAALRELDVFCYGFDADTVRALANSLALSGLKGLTLEGRIGASGARAVLDSPYLTRLERFWVSARFDEAEPAPHDLVAELRRRFGERCILQM